MIKNNVKRNTMRVKKGDLVKVIAGGQKGKTGKIVKADAQNQLVFVEKIGMIKRNIKPSQKNPRGGSKEIHRGLPVSNVAIVVDEAKGKTSRVAYGTNKEGKKIRLAKATRKEIA